MVGHLCELVDCEREWAGEDWLVDVVRCSRSSGGFVDVVVRCAWVVVDIFWVRVGSDELPIWS